jgi:hypothetical protein
VALLFFKKAVPASYSDNLELAGYSGEKVYFESDGCPLRGLHAFVTDPITAGSIVVTDSKAGKSVTLSSTTPRAAVDLASALGPAEKFTVAAVASGLAPTTADLVVLVET